MPENTLSLIYKSAIDDVIIYRPTKFEDERGKNYTNWDKNWKFPCKFVQSKITIGKKNVLRGLHGDKITYKLISCLYGEIELAVVDVRKESETYGKYISYNLNNKNNLSILVPPRCFNGHICLSDNCVFQYFWSEPYSGPENQETIIYNDKDLNIKWTRKENLILSNRDKQGNRFKEINF